MRAARINAREALIVSAKRNARLLSPFCARWLWAALLALIAASCATIPGGNYPKQASSAFDRPEATALGQAVAAAGQRRPGLSGFRLLADGGDSLRARLDLAAAAQRSLDLQYYLFKNDVTGKLLIDTVLRAADRGVRVRMLIDDTEDLVRNKQIIAVAAHRGIEVRIFNPYYAHGLFDVLRYGEFVLERRLNYRMHNKVFVVDNAAAVVGGRNIGDDYFDASDQTDRKDFDVLAVGGIVRPISASFDAYWNSDLAIPVQALLVSKPDIGALEAYRSELEENRRKVQSSDRIPVPDADPLHALLAGDSPLIWAKSEVLYDNPDKLKVESGEKRGPLLRDRLIEALGSVQSELLIVSPYLVPADEGMKLLERLRQRNVRVGIVTNSLASTDLPVAHSGYEHYRVRLLADGIELYEAKLSPAAGDGDGHSLKSPSSGKFDLHAKVFVLDRKRLFVGSMNFDYRSLRINTEIGLLIDNEELARQAGVLFDAMAQPANSYALHLGASDDFGKRQLTWRTEENGKSVELTSEPMGDILRGIQASLFTLLPIDDLL